MHFRSSFLLSLSLLLFPIEVTFLKIKHLKEPILLDYRLPFEDS